MYWSRGLFYFFNTDIAFLTFSRAHSPGWHVQTPGTPACCGSHLGWEPALTRRALPEPPQQAGENPSSSSSHLVKAQVRIAGACGRPCRSWGHWISSVLPPKLPWAPKFCILAAAPFPPRVLLSQCVPGNLQVVTWDRRISPSFCPFPSFLLSPQPPWSSSTRILGPPSAQGDLQVEVTPIQPLWGNCCQKLGHWNLERDSRQEHVQIRLLITVWRWKRVDLN